MPLEITNSLTRKREPFVPLREGEVGLYVCGLTVYDDAHIGHARMFLVFDIIRRTLEAKGFRVKHVCNHTDVDDKIIARALEANENPRDRAERFIKTLEKDLDDLGILRPHVAPRVTTHIPQIIALIEKLIEKGYAYQSNGDVYYAVDRFPEYGKLSGRSLEEMWAGESNRVSLEETRRKQNPLDFALWKAQKPGEPDCVAWDSPWGKGRPGWHIECSAMSEEHLGSPFDIHGGGKDLLFPHHENEIAQSEAASGHALARYWIHNGYLNAFTEVDGKRVPVKMSKSLGNFYTVRDILARHSAESFRYFCLKTHYHQDINFEVEFGPDGKTVARFPGLDEAAKRVAYGYETLRKIDNVLAVSKAQGGKPCLPEDFSQKFLEAMQEDFNTSKALGIIANFFRYANEAADRKERCQGLSKPDRIATLAALREQAKIFSQVLGLWGKDPAASLREIRDKAARERGLDPEAITRKVAELDQFRAQKEYHRSDAIREELKALGVQVNNAAGGSEWMVIL